MLLAALVAPAGAATGQIGGGVDPDGVTITIVRWQGADLVRATGSDGGADPSGCDWAVVPAPVGVLPPPDIGPWRPDAYLGLLTCDGQGVRVLWVGPHNTVDLEAVARARVAAYVARVPLPDLTVGANPEPAGIVGIESWFWLDGYDGAPVVDTIDALGFSVEVRIEATPVRWRFGDGTVVTGGLGAAWPARSPVRHVYTRHGRWPVRTDMDWVPRYRIAGADWVELDRIPLVATATHRVLEVRAVLVPVP